MQRSFNEVLSELLVIIKYPQHNKEKFIKEFEELNHGEAVANLLDKLPTHIQEQLKGNRNLMEEIKNHITAEEYKKEVTRVAQGALLKFVEVVSPVITLEQKQKIVNILQ